MIVLPVKLGVRGAYRARVLDEFGNVQRGRGGVPVARDASGFLRRLADWRPNIVTDAGLDQILATEKWLYTGTSAGTPLRTTLRVGDGTGTPAAGDTALGNQVGATTSSGGFTNGDVTRTVGASDMTLEGEAVRVYTNSTGAGQNLSEFGFGQTSGSDLVVRELLRDDADNPITISLQDGKKLRIDHTAQLVIPLETSLSSLDIVELDAEGNTVQTLSYSAKIWPCADNLWCSRLDPQQMIFADFVVTATQQTTEPDHSDGLSYDTNNAADGTLDDPGGYTPGSFVHEYQGGVGEAQANGFDVHTFLFGQAAGGRMHGYAVALQDGPQPKDNQHTLDVFLEMTLARA